MSVRDEDLRTAYRGTVSPSGPCPDAETLVRAAEGSLAAGEREAVVAHLGTCTLCADDVRTAFAALGESSRPRVPSSKSLTRWLAVAAVVVLSAGAVVVLLRRNAPPESAGERGGSIAAQRTSPGNGAIVDEAPAALAWENGPAAEEYVVVLSDAEARLLWQSPPSKEPRAALPPEVRARLEAGRRYLWRVKSTRGFETRESPVFGFTLKAR